MSYVPPQWSGGPLIGAGEPTADGTPLTGCHVLFTGRRKDPLSCIVKGLYYSEVIFVYLTPSKSEY